MTRLPLLPDNQSQPSYDALASPDVFALCRFLGFSQFTGFLLFLALFRACLNNGDLPALCRG
jgi:hypothetical protein